jgi:hypothetical protein
MAHSRSMETLVGTIVKMVESLPDELQGKVIEYIRDYIADLEDEARWDTLCQRTQVPSIVAFQVHQQ